MSRYQINSVEYPSVSEILGQLDKSGAMMGWAVNCMADYILINYENYMQDDNFDQLILDAKRNYRDVSTDAKDIGSEVHSSIESYIKFGRDKIGVIKPEVENALIAFWTWEKENNVKWIESEMPVVNESIGFAGTLDAIAEVNGVIVCIDFKSSKDVYDEYITQVIAYKFARESMNGVYDIKGPVGNYTREYKKIEIKECGILRLDKYSGAPEWYPIDSQEKIKREWISFQALLNYFYVAKRRRLKNNVRAI